MNTKAPHERNIGAPRIGLFIGSAIAITILIALGLVILLYVPLRTENSLILGLIIILGVSVLIVLLFIMAAAFYSLNLTNPREALGLPPGSVRAMIALLLIIVWAIVSIFIVRLFALPTFYSSTSGGSLQLFTPSQDAVKIAQQLFTTMSTLVVAVAAFYFGSSSVRAAHTALAPSSEQPIIMNIIPKSGSQNTNVHLTILGKNFGSPKSVRLVRDQDQINAEPPTFTQTEISIIECNISIAAEQTTGKWDVIVVNYDGTESKVERGFAVTK